MKQVLRSLRSHQDDILRRTARINIGIPPSDIDSN